MTNNKPLHAPLAIAMLLLSRELMPTGYDTTDNYEDVNTFDKLKSYYARTGRYLVWIGASEYTIYGPWQANAAFRSVHDWIHLNFDLGFTVEHEKLVYEIQEQLIHSVMCRNPLLRPHIARALVVMKADLLGIVAFNEKHGYYPKYQKDFVASYLENPEAALKTLWTKYESN